MIDKKLVEITTEKLKEKNIKIATAESCTGGLLAHILTNISGSSEYFERGVITYSNKAKKELLNVSETILKKYGAVSKEVATEMAKRILKKSKVDIGISSTGIAGPAGGSKEKPVGLVYIGVSTSNKTIVKKFIFNGDRLENKENTVNNALKMILETLKDI